MSVLQNNTTFQCSSLVYGLCANLFMYMGRLVTYQQKCHCSVTQTTLLVFRKDDRTLIDNSSLRESVEENYLWKNKKLSLKKSNKKNNKTFFLNHILEVYSLISKRIIKMNPQRIDRLDIFVVKLWVCLTKKDLIKIFF